jgi:hypothetical protein
MNMTRTVVLKRVTGRRSACALTRQPKERAKLEAEGSSDLAIDTRKYIQMDIKDRSRY